MPAVVRGGSYYHAKPRPKAPKTSTASRPRQQSRARVASGPAKIRAAQSIGLKPGAALAIASAIAAFSLIVAIVAGGRLPKVASAVGHGLGGELALAGFKISSVSVEGASPQAKADILKASGLKRGQPILDVDLGALRGRVEQVGWVKSAKVVRLLPDTLVISVSERSAAAVWQHNGRATVVDSAGQVIPEADPGRFPDLPLVVGEGANDAAGDILPLVRARPRLLARMEALVRVDGRRWDVRLKDGGLIQLPALNEDSALIQLDQLDQQQQILTLGFERIDLRDPEMVAVRPKAGAAPPPQAAVPQQAAGSHEPDKPA